MKRCVVCGREGTRGFDGYGASTFSHPTLGMIYLSAFDECSAKAACHRRCYRQIPARTRIAVREGHL